MTGTIFAQALNVVLSPVITRIYTPEDYGILTLYIAILGLINLVGSLAYEYAIPIAEDDKKAFDLILLCFIILTIFTIVLTLGIVVVKDSFFSVLKIQKIITYKYFIPLGFFLTGAYTIFVQWSFRKKDFKSISMTKYTQSITGNFIKIGFGLIYKYALGLILGNILSQSAGAIILVKPYIGKFKEALREIECRRLIKLAIRYRKFPMYTAPSFFIMSASTQLPIVFLSALYESTSVGFYGLARSIVFLPMIIVGKNIQDVFYSEIASIGKVNLIKIKKISNRLLKKLVLLGVLPLVAIVVFGPKVFSLIFGQEWIESGYFARILSIEVFFHFVFQPISSIFSVLEEQRKALILEFFRIGFVIVLFFIADKFSFKIETTILGYSILMSMVEILKYFAIQQIFKKIIEINDLKFL